MQYHEVKIEFKFASAPSGIDSSYTPAVTLWVDYIFLDVDERRRFAQSAHEYLIEQLQFTGTESVTPSASSQVSVRTRLNMNHPVKYLAWVIKGTNHGQYTAFPTTDIGNTGTYAEALAPLYDAKLTLNGHDRFDTRKGSYFNLVQPMQTMRAKVPAGIGMYSFSLKPNEHQPSGTCNFSRIDNATLQLTLKQCSNTGTITAANPVPFAADEGYTHSNGTNLTALNIYAKNYNVLRIMSGMGGLAYSS